MTALPIDDATVDMTIVARSTGLMQQMLLECVLAPMNPEPLRRAAEVQRMLIADVAEAGRRLEQL